jgi:tetratricopeptide (TPR) repeat protein
MQYTGQVWPYFPLLRHPSPSQGSDGESSMEFYALLDQVLELLRQRGRVTLGDYRLAIDYLEKTMALLEGELRHVRLATGLTSVLSRGYLTRCLAELGKFAEGLAWGEEGIRIAEAVDNAFSRIHVYCGVGLLYLRKGDLQKAMPLGERALALHKVAHLPAFFHRVAMALARLWPITRHNRPRRFSAPRQSAGLLPQHALDATWTNGNASTNNAWRAPAPPRRLAALSWTTPPGGPAGGAWRSSGLPARARARTIPTAPGSAEPSPRRSRVSALPFPYGPALLRR